MKEHTRSGALTETTLYILLALYSANHGYGIMQFIEEQTAGRLVLGPGTLYGALSNLLDKGWIILHSEEGTKKKKNYLITSLGKEIVANELIRLQQVLHLGTTITSKEIE